MDGLVMILGMNTSKLHNQQKQIELELVSSLWLDLTNGFSGRITAQIPPGVLTRLNSYLKTQISDSWSLIDFFTHTTRHENPADDLRKPLWVLFLYNLLSGILFGEAAAVKKDVLQLCGLYSDVRRPQLPSLLILIITTFWWKICLLLIIDER